MTRRSPSEQSFAGGFHAVEAALAGGRVTRLLVARGRVDRRMQALLDRAGAASVPVVRSDRKDLDVRVRGRHQGVVAELGGDAVGADFLDEGELEAHLEALVRAGATPLLLVLEGLTDPRNLGACLRSADGAGVHGVVVPRSRTAPLTSAARNVASGAAETVPVYAAANLARTLRWLGQRGITLVGLAEEGDRAPWEVDLRGPLALLMGAEDSGLRRLTRDACDALVALPMAGTVSSLNVSVAAGISLYEVVRQRGGGSA